MSQKNYSPQTHFQPSNNLKSGRETIRDKMNHLESILTDISNLKAGKLIYHLYRKYNSTYQEIGQVLRVSRQRVEQMWPKGGENK
jgi:DNA-directed RNA polymerase specialized sigma subunit